MDDPRKVPESGRESVRPSAPQLPELRLAAEYLELLQVGDSERTLILDARPKIAGDQVLYQVFRDAGTAILRDMGKPVLVSGPPVFPRVHHEDPAARWVYIWAMLATVPHVRSYHRAIGVPSEVSLRSLRRLASAVRRRSTLHGLDGARHESGLPLVFRGVSFVFGPLGFDRTTVWFDHTVRPGLTCVLGEPGLKLHVSAGRGLEPEQCERALQQAQTFFLQHFGLEAPVFISRSWLLDPQLRQFLAPTSSIRQYQSRFALVPESASRSSSGTAAVLEYVFGHYGNPSLRGDGLGLSSTRGETTLTRAIEHHLASGRDFAIRTGWFRWTDRSG